MLSLYLKGIEKVGCWISFLFCTSVSCESLGAYGSRVCSAFCCQVSLKRARLVASCVELRTEPCLRRWKDIKLTALIIPKSKCNNTLLNSGHSAKMNVWHLSMHSLVVYTIVYGMEIPCGTQFWQKNIAFRTWPDASLQP